MNSTQWANARAAIYAVVAAALALLVGYDVVSSDRSAEWLDFTDKIIAAVALILAYRNVGRSTLPGTGDDTEPV